MNQGSSKIYGSCLQWRSIINNHRYDCWIREKARVGWAEAHIKLKARIDQPMTKMIQFTDNGPALIYD